MVVRSEKGEGMVRDGWVGVGRVLGRRVTSEKVVTRELGHLRGKVNIPSSY